MPRTGRTLTTTTDRKPAALSLPLAARGFVAGVDEAGRGPLAGPVVAAAVILDPRKRIRGIRDSKLVEPEERTELAIKSRVGRRRRDRCA